MNIKDWWEDEDFDVNMTEEIIAASQPSKCSESISKINNFKSRSSSFNENGVKNNKDADNLTQKVYLLQGENKSLMENLNNLKNELKNTQMVDNIKQEENKYHLNFIQQKSEQDLERLKSEIIFKDKEINDLKGLYISNKVSASKCDNIKAQPNRLTEDGIKKQNVYVQTENGDFECQSQIQKINNMHINQIMKITYDLYIFFQNFQKKGILQKTIQNQTLLSQAIFELHKNIEKLNYKKPVNFQTIFYGFLTILPMLDHILELYIILIHINLKETISKQDTIQKSDVFLKKWINCDYWFRALIFDYAGTNYHMRTKYSEDIVDLNLLNEIIEGMFSLIDLFYEIIAIPIIANVSLSTFINAIIYKANANTLVDEGKEKKDGGHTWDKDEFIELFKDIEKNNCLIQNCIACIVVTIKISESIIPEKNMIITKLMRLLVHIGDFAHQENQPYDLPKLIIPPTFLKCMVLDVHKKSDPVRQFTLVINLFTAFLHFGYDISKSSCGPVKNTPPNKANRVPCVLQVIIETALTLLNGYSGEGGGRDEQMSSVTIICKLTNFLLNIATRNQLKKILEKNSCPCSPKFFHFTSHALEYLSDLYPDYDPQKSHWVGFDDTLEYVEAKYDKEYAGTTRSSALTIIHYLHILSRKDGDYHNPLSDPALNPLQRNYCEFHERNRLLVLLYEALTIFFTSRDNDPVYQDLILDLIQPLMSQEEIDQLLDDQNPDVEMGS